MYLKQDINYVSINTDKFNIFAPIGNIENVILFSSLANEMYLHVNCNENQKRFHIEGDYSSLLNIYSQISGQLERFGFIDIVCGKTHISLRKDSIAAISRDTLNMNQTITLFYESYINNNRSRQSIILMESSGKDLTQEYMNVLGQISYVPRNIQVNTPKTSFNNVSFWNSQNNYPIYKKIEKTEKIEEDWCFIS